MTNKYLEKIALTRVVKELAKGAFGYQGSLGKSQAVYDLMRAGAIRSPKVYQEGMKRGNQAIAKATGQNITKARPGRLLDASGDPIDFSTSIRKTQNGVTPQVIHPHGGGLEREKMIVDANLEEGLKGLHPNHRENFVSQIAKFRPEVGIRHELFEGRYLKKSPAIAESHSVGTGEGNVPARFARQNPYRTDSVSTILRPGSSKGSYWITGLHKSLGVLGHESEVIRKNPYLTGLSTGIGTHRFLEGEEQLLQHITGKRYGVDKFTGKDIRKLENAKPMASIKDPSDLEHRIYEPPGRYRGIW